MKKYKILAIMGQAGSGKDSLMHSLIKYDFIHNAKPIVSCTTRPIREHEIDGVNYHYLTNDEFAEQVLNGEMLEATVFNNWCYGTSIKNLYPDCLNIGVFNPEGVEILQESKDVDLEVVYIVADDKVRLLRQLNREEHPNCDEIIRRFGTDKKDFSDARISAISPDYKLQNNGDKSIDMLALEFSMAYNVRTNGPLPLGKN